MLTPWPYPRWIAHRGAGRLAPENTLAALICGAQHGYRMFECDVQVSRDGVPFLLHDATLERTSNGHGLAHQQTWPALAALDAGSWHSPAYAQEGLATLERIAHFCVGRGYALNIELKPSLGQEERTGTLVANAAARWWAAAALPPLLTSFQTSALQAAQAAQPQLARGLLLDAWPQEGIATALALGCVAVVAQHRLWTAQRVAQARQAGLGVLAYTVNDAARADNLIALGLDGLITDRVDSLGPGQKEP